MILFNAAESIRRFLFVCYCIIFTFIAFPRGNILIA